MESKDSEEQTFKKQKSPIYVVSQKIMCQCSSHTIRKCTRLSITPESTTVIGVGSTYIGECGFQFNTLTIAQNIFHNINLYNCDLQFHHQNREHLSIFSIFYNPLNYCGTHRDCSNLFYSPEVSIKIIETCFQLIDTLCNMIDGYGQHTALSDEACSTQYIIYYIWFSIMGVYFIFRMIGVYLAYEAYKFLRAKHNIEETKKKRKLRYLEMYKEKEQKKGEIQNQKYGDRKL